MQSLTELGYMLKRAAPFNMLNDWGGILSADKGLHTIVFNLHP